MASLHRRDPTQFRRHQRPRNTYRHRKIFLC
ncbi:hypothetical protein CVT26_011301 [Gymnopilus dilepis]|uniref:Uncharacterized protein n=1 Tax=Gymnopilus dilepis TaxID=231916 RepID=A0A409XC14_9AGAR|nr:hypothetical protein CVT26_011301 [Gymnopilus dilepis]